MIINFRNRFCNISRGLAVLFGLLFALHSAAALPPPLPTADRYAGSDIVILATLSDTQRRKFNDISESVSLKVTVERVFKNEAIDGGAGAALPDSFHLAFLVFPQTFEAHLRRPVGDGRYILFLKRKSVQDAEGHAGEAIVLFEPRPFAFIMHSAEAVQEVEELSGTPADTP